MVRGLHHCISDPHTSKAEKQLSTENHNIADFHTLKLPHFPQYILARFAGTVSLSSTRHSFSLQCQSAAEFIENSQALMI